MWCFMWHLCFGWKMPIACIVCTKLIFSLFRHASTTLTDTHAYPLPRYQSLGKYANVVADHKISHYANELNREVMKFSTVSIKYPQNMPYIPHIGSTVLRQGSDAAIRHIPGACKNINDASESCLELKSTKISFVYTFGFTLTICYEILHGILQPCTMQAIRKNQIKWLIWTKDIFVQVGFGSDWLCQLRPYASCKLSHTVYG